MTDAEIACRIADVLWGAWPAGESYAPPKLNEIDARYTSMPVWCRDRAHSLLDTIREIVRSEMHPDEY
jgi:hypothetical protein